MEDIYEKIKASELKRIADALEEVGLSDSEYMTCLNAANTGRWASE